MKKRNIMILVFMLVIGFAAVSTTLVINGNLNIGYNEENFSSSVVYTRPHTILYIDLCCVQIGLLLLVDCFYVLFNGVF